MIYRVYVSSYGDVFTIGVFSRKDAAIKFARSEARKTNEEFTGNIGYGVGIEWLDAKKNDHGSLDENWADWKVTIKNDRFVLAD